MSNPIKNPPKYKVVAYYSVKEIAEETLRTEEEVSGILNGKVFVVIDGQMKYARGVWTKYVLPRVPGHTRLLDIARQRGISRMSVQKKLLMRGYYGLIWNNKPIAYYADHIWQEAFPPIGDAEISAGEVASLYCITKHELAKLLRTYDFVGKKTRKAIGGKIYDKKEIFYFMDRHVSRYAQRPLELSKRYGCFLKTFAEIAERLEIRWRKTYVPQEKLDAIEEEFRKIRPL